MKSKKNVCCFCCWCECDSGSNAEIDTRVNCHEQIVRQRACHKQIWPVSGARSSLEKSYLSFRLIITQNLVAVSHHMGVGIGVSQILGH